VATFLLGFTLAPRVAAARRGERAFDLGLEPGLVPRDAIRFVDGNDLGGRMYNDLEVGSYLTWHWQGRHPVFQDPRINGYPPAFHAVLRRNDLSRAEWDALLAGFGTTSALVTYPAQNPRAAWFDPARWALVYRAADGLVFVRRGTDFAGLAARAELPITFAANHASEVSAQPLEARPTGSPVSDCEWKRRLGDFFTEAGDDTRALAAYRDAGATAGCLDEPATVAVRMAMGDAALRLQDPATAAAAYAGIDRPRAHTNRALALLGLGRAREALDEAHAALAQDPDSPDARTAERLARERLGLRTP